MNEKEGEEAVEDQNCAEGYKIYQKLKLLSQRTGFHCEFQD